MTNIEEKSDTEKLDQEKFTKLVSEKSKSISYEDLQVGHTEGEFQALCEGYKKQCVFIEDNIYDLYEEKKCLVVDEIQKRAEVAKISDKRIIDVVITETLEVMHSTMLKKIEGKPALWKNAEERNKAMDAYNELKRIKKDQPQKDTEVKKKKRQIGMDAQQKMIQSKVSKSGFGQEPKSEGDDDGNSSEENKSDFEDENESKSSATINFDRSQMDKIREFKRQKMEENPVKLGSLNLNKEQKDATIRAFKNISKTKGKKGSLIDKIKETSKYQELDERSKKDFEKLAERCDYNEIQAQFDCIQNGFTNKPKEKKKKEVDSGTETRNKQMTQMQSDMYGDDNEQ